MALLVFHLSIGLWNCSDSVALLGFLLGFGTIPTVWHYWFFYWHLELIRQCGIICFDMGFWNCSDSVALFICIWDIGTVPIVWHYLIFYWALELFRQCGIICFSIGLWKCSDSVTLCFLFVTVELIRECGIIWFSIGLGNCSDSVALFVLIWDFETVLTVWHYLFFYWTYIFCVDRYWSFCTFSLYHSIICLSLNEFWFHMWNFQTFLSWICISEFVFNNMLYNFSCWINRSVRWRIPYRSTSSPGSITSWINRRHLQ